MKTKHIFMLLFAITANLINAQNSNIASEPGYVNFGDLSIFDNGDMVTEVILEEHLLKMVSKMTMETEPGVAELISGLKLIKVNVFEVSESNKKEIYSMVSDINDELTNKNWDRIVKVRDRSERTNVYIKTENNDKIVGLVVMAIDENGEAAFVNIVGHINLESIGKLSKKFGIPALDSINVNEE